MKKSVWENALFLYTSIYTFATLLNSVLYLQNGVYEDPNGNWHEIDRAIIVLIGVLAFELCTNLKTKPIILRYIIAYIPSQLLAFAYIWLSGMREPLAKSAYFDIWVNFTWMWLLICFVSFAIDRFKKPQAEK